MYRAPSGVGKLKDGERSGVWASGKWCQKVGLWPSGFSGTV
jgi:hypothetical protein